MRVAKERGVAVILVGHVTKEGALAGPRVLEHLVDCVLSFEGERERTYRTLRALKNRFGSTNEAGVFEMRDEGLVEVEDASARFVAEATPGAGLGGAVRDGGLAAPAGGGPGARGAHRAGAAAADGQRRGPQPPGAGAGRARPPRRRSLWAAATCSCRVAGGVRVDEPGADLAVALAVASAARGVALGSGERPLAAFGELGLTGELRHAAHPDRRLAEAAKFGLAGVLCPGGAAARPALAPWRRASARGARGQARAA